MYIILLNPVFSVTKTFKMKSIVQVLTFVYLFTSLNAQEENISKYTKEVESLTIEISKHPDNLALYYQLANAYNNLNDFAASNQTYSKLIQLYRPERDSKFNEDVAGAYYKLADDYYYRKSSPANALEFTQAGLKISPANKDLKVLEAIILGADPEKKDLAKIKFEEVLNKYPDDEKLNLHFARLLEKDDMDQAIKYFEQALSVNPTNSDVLFILGAYYINEASQMYRSTDLDLNKVFDYTKKGVHYFEQFHQLHPEDKEVIGILVEYYTYLGREEDANELERKLHQ